MKKLFVQYAAYNLWANQRITEAINNLTNDQINAHTKSSFGNIQQTLLHLWAAENIWWQRLKLIEREVWIGNDFEGTIMELSKNLLQQSKQWKEWVDIATEAALQHEFIYKNNKKDQFKQPVYETLVHLFNHQTYHRGQLVSLMLQAGETNIPNTDMIAFLRKK